MSIMQLNGSLVASDQILSTLRAELARQGAVVTSSDPYSLSGAVTYRKRPSIALGILLLCFFILPGVLYLTLGGRTKVDPFVIQLGQNPGEPWQVRVSGRGYGLKAAEWAVRQLP